MNYRHFEDDANPRVFKKEGLKHLDRVVNLVGDYRLPLSMQLTSSLKPEVWFQLVFALIHSARNTASILSSTCIPLQEVGISR